MHKFMSWLENGTSGLRNAKTKAISVTKTQPFLSLPAGLLVYVAASMYWKMHAGFNGKTNMEVGS